MQEAIRDRRKHSTMLENSPVGESRSNGLSEKAVQEVTGMIRTFLDQAEDKLNSGRNDEDKIEIKGPLIAWLIEHAASAITRAKVGMDGKTPYQRLKGKRFMTTPPMWLERVLYKPLSIKGGKLNKLAPRFEYGVYLGTSMRTGEVFLGTKEGCIKARSYKRLPADQKWTGDIIREINGTPWAL